MDVRREQERAALETYECESQVSEIPPYEQHTDHPVVMPHLQLEKYAPSYHSYTAVSQPDGAPWRRRRRLFIWIGAIIILIAVTVGGIVGGVFGSRAAREDDNTSASTAISSLPVPEALQDTGLAVLTSASGDTRYAYEQDVNGNIVEIPYTLEHGWMANYSTIIATNAYRGTPLAAANYSLGSTVYRAVTYIDLSGQVMIVDTGANSSWTTPVNVAINTTASTTSPALALCVDTQYLYGMRLYYPSSNGTLHEVGLDFAADSPSWTARTNFTGPDIRSGVACSISNGINHLYYRNNLTVQQWYWDYANNDTTWRQGSASPVAYPPDLFTDIAVATAGGTDYVYYRLTSGTFVECAVFDTLQDHFDAYANHTAVPATSRFATTWFVDTWSERFLLLSQPIGSNNVSWATYLPQDGAMLNGTLN